MGEVPVQSHPDSEHGQRVHADEQPEVDRADAVAPEQDRGRAEPQDRQEDHHQGDASLAPAGGRARRGGLGQRRDRVRPSLGWARRQGWLPGSLDLGPPDREDTSFPARKRAGIRRRRTYFVPPSAPRVKSQDPTSSYRVKYNILIYLDILY